MKKHYETHVEDTDKLISVAGPVLDYKSWYEQYRKLMEEQAQRKYGLYTPTSEGDEDDFPSIPGMIARYSALGLTNEQMEQNPVWVDKTGNGHDLQMKNLAWGGMSGVGGYNQNFNQWGYGNLSTATQTHTSYKIELSVPSTLKTANIYSNANSIGKEGDVYDFTLNIVGLKDGALLRITKGVVSGVIERIEKDGIYKIYQPIEAGWDQPRIYIFISNPNLVDLNITIEQLPLYPGALVFDGVDDYGVCDNFPILTKEKGYTVVALRQWITYNPNAISAIATNASDQSFNGAFTFENYNKGAEQTISYGATQISLQYSKSPFSWQTTSKYNGVNIANGNKDATNSLVLGRSYPQRNDFANFAIWELVFLDHDATEEELTKIKDYFVKTYPWLFPDQAWTVVGKTNEDEDRATIANITGNGNNLVLSNFGFAEGSGYGLYETNFMNWVDSHRATFTRTSSKINVTAVLKEEYATFTYSTESRLKQRIKVTGLPEGVSLILGRTNFVFYTIAQDGIYDIDVTDDSGSSSPIIGYRINKILDSCDITIEQIPEYEGYLVTDGVDDIASSNTFVYEADFTFIGEWKFIQKDNTVAGINSVSHLYIQNRYNRGATVMINSTFENKKNITDYMTFKAITSKGKAYDENWNEVDLLYGDGNKGLSGVNIGGQGGTEFCHMIFKNMALYMNKVFSKDDCIKAYNYLQTLKAK